MSMIRVLVMKAFACLFASLPLASIAEVDYAAEVAFEHRLFWETPLFPEQLAHHQTSVLIEPEWNWQSESTDFQLNFVGYYRWDDRDSERSHGDVRELYALYRADNWDLLVGINKVFWGVTESRHLVDVINQTDMLEDVDQEDKLGQPMINISTLSPWGEWSLFLLPRFRELEFPGEKGRYRGAFRIDTGNRMYESDEEDQHLDWAIRYAHVLGNIDIGVSYFDGTQREARLVPGSGGTLVPVYDLMTQIGVDLQYTGEVWLLKLEALYRDARLDDFGASVIGAEYTFYQVLESAADIGVLVEYLWDDRDLHAPATSFDRDIFFGGRVTLNDTQDTQVLGGFIVDTDHRHTFFTLEAERRLNDRWSLDISIRATLNASEEDPLNFISKDDHIRAKLSWFF